MDAKSKYNRKIVCQVEPGIADVYTVLETFDVRCAARQHAIKKLLCAGLRNKGSALQDLEETLVAVQAAIRNEKSRVEDRRIAKPPAPPEDGIPKSVPLVVDDGAL